jgi:moderate conductance mechanosensitive channel
MTLSELPGWMVWHGLALVVGGLIIFGVYRILQPFVHRVVLAVLQVQQVTLPGAEPAEELQKRATTLEEILNKLLRAAFVVALVILILGVFNLGELLAGLGLLAAALTLAGQAIVLDYLMGILILVEGPFYKGDWISIQAPGVSVEGEVEEITLRRTTLRDGMGALQSVSNGLIRVSANLTRVYSIATVDVQIVRPQDLERALAVAARVVREFESDPDWVGRLVPSPIGTWVTALSLDGATVRLQRRVPPALRLEATSELRRRLSATFAAESIGTGRWDTPPLAAAPPVVDRVADSEDGTPAPTPEGQ